MYNYKIGNKGVGLRYGKSYILNLLIYLNIGIFVR